MTRVRASQSIAWLTVAFATAPRLGAQTAPDVRTQADRAFEEGKAAIQKGDWAFGCSRFEQSFDWDPAPSTSIKLARCREHEGRFATAEREYQRASELNERLTERPERKAELAAVIRDGRAAIASKISYLGLSITPHAAGLEVTLDGSKLAESAYAAPLPVDPGEHEVTVRAPGYRLERRKPNVVQGSKSGLAVSLVPETPASAAPAKVASPPTAAAPVAPVARAAPAPTAPPDRGPPTAKPASSSQRTFGLVVGGAGVASLGVAGFFGIRTLLLVNEADAHCDADGACDHDGVGLIRQADDAQTVALVCAGVGAALIGVGAGLYLTAPSGARSGAGPRFLVGLDARGAKLEGSF